MTRPTDLHPIEAGLLLALLTIRALRVVLVALVALVLLLAGWQPSKAPQPARPTQVPTPGAGAREAALLHSCLQEGPGGDSCSPAFRPALVPAYSRPTVTQLRRQVRALHGPGWRAPDGRRAAQARRCDLLRAMALEVAA